jgi:hypothetical protein
MATATRSVTEACASAREAAFELARIVQGALVEGHDGVERRVVARYPLEARPDDLDR